MLVTDFNTSVDPEKTAKNLLYACYNEDNSDKNDCYVLPNNFIEDWDSVLYIFDALDGCLEIVSEKNWHNDKAVAIFSINNHKAKEECKKAYVYNDCLGERFVLSMPSDHVSIFLPTEFALKIMYYVGIYLDRYKNLDYKPSEFKESSFAIPVIEDKRNKYADRFSKEMVFSSKFMKKMTKKLLKKTVNEFSLEKNFAIELLIGHLEKQKR